MVWPRRGLALASLAVAMGAAGGFAACTSLDLTGGNPADASDEALADALALPDVRDAAPENAPPAEGGLESATDAQDATATWCALQMPPHSLCADFDTPSYLGQWSTTAVALDASLLQDPDASTSPPNSLRVEIGSQGGSQAVLLKDFPPGPPAEVRVEFDVLVDTLGETTTDIARVSFPAAYSIGAVLAGMGNMTTIAVEEATRRPDGGYVYDDPITASFIPSGKWVHVSMDIVFDSDAGASAALRVTGLVAMAAPITIPMLPADAGYNVYTGLDHYSNGPFFAWSAHIDNFTVDVR